jgi:hypothetical protein
MRNYLVVFALVLCTASTAFGQRRGGDLPSFNKQVSGERDPEAIQAARRRAAGIQDLQGYGKATEPKKKPFPWKALGLVGFVALLCVPFALKMVRSTRKDLEDQATFGVRANREASSASGSSRSRRPPSRGAGRAAREARAAEVAEPARSARDAIWDVLAGGGGWMRADEVARGSGLSLAEAADEIGALVEEGYLQEARDRAGQPIFKVAS